MRKCVIVILLGLFVAMISSCAPTFKKFRTINNAPDEWSMFRNSLTGYYQKDVYGSDIRSLAWKGEMKARSYTSPVATASYVAVGARDSYMYFFDLEQGERINAYKFESPVAQSPMISNKILYSAAGPDENFVTGINLINGKPVFKKRYPDVQAPVVGDEQFLYFGDHAGIFYCIDKFSGTEMWSFKTEGQILNAPAIYGGIIYFGSLDKHLYALDRESGDLIWSASPGGALNSAPAVDSTAVYIGSYDGYVYALDIADGSLIWKSETGAQITSSPVIDDYNVYIGSNDRSMYCLEKSTGRWVWDFPSDGAINSAPLVLEDVVVFGSIDGRMYMLYKNSGALIFSHETEDMIRSSPIYFNGKIFVSSLDKHLYCFSR